MGRRGRIGVVLALAAVGAASLAAFALAERTQQGTLIVSLRGGISPRKLPRHDLAPASVQLSGDLRTSDGAPLPQLRRVELALAARGALGTRGLPVCPRRRLEATTAAAALAACGPALVGHGRLDVAVFIPGQEPFDFHATLRAFNGRLGGRPAVWLHVYGSRPPSAFVLPFAVRRRHGSFPTALVATIPSGLGPWPHLARFQMTFGRRFAYRGKPRSYLNANCPLPPRFTAGLFPFARATYTLADGDRLSTTIVRGCRVRQAP